jgi:hypothetical protein
MTVTLDRKPSEEEQFPACRNSFAFKTVVDGCLVTTMMKTRRSRGWVDPVPDPRYCIIRTKLAHVELVTYVWSCVICSNDWTQESWTDLDKIWYGLHATELEINNKPLVRFQVLTAASIQFRVFWDVLTCSQADVDRRFRGAYCLHQALMMEAVCTSETSVKIYFTIPQYIPEDSKINRPLDGGSSETYSQHEQQQNVQVFPADYCSIPDA